MQDTIDLYGWVEHLLRPGVLEIALATVFDLGHVGIHDHVFRAGQLFDKRAAGAMIDVRVADEQDFDVGEAEAQLLDALPDLRHRGCEITVDQDVSLRRSDQESGQVFTADVVNISDDAMRRERLDPFGIGLRNEICCGLGKKTASEEEGYSEQARKHRQPA